VEDAQGEREVVYGREDWSQLQLAYAITIHRAQGSEWDNVVVVVSGGLENRVSSEPSRSALELAVANTKIARRYSGLAERLKHAVVDVAAAPAAEGDREQTGRSPTSDFEAWRRGGGIPSARRHQGFIRPLNVLALSLIDRTGQSSVRWLRSAVRRGFSPPAHNVIDAVPHLLAEKAAV
jgi:hypothetical protein